MKKILYGVIGAVIIVIIAGAAWLYTGKLSQAKIKVFKKFPLPVAVAGNSFVNGQEFIARFELAQILYKDDPTYKAADTENQILDELIDGVKLKKLAAAHNITAASGDIDAEYKGIVTQYAGGDDSKFVGLLDQTYHLSISDFKLKVILPDVLKTNLNIWYNGQRDLNKAAFDLEQSLQDKLKQGQAFEDVVKAYTQDAATKDFGGDVGSVKLSELATEFKSGLANAKAGDQVTITSRDGIHIVKVVEIDKSGTEPAYHLQQIFIKEDGFDAWYAQQTAAIKTHKLVKF